MPEQHEQHPTDVSIPVMHSAATSDKGFPAVYFSPVPAGSRSDFPALFANSSHGNSNANAAAASLSRVNPTFAQSTATGTPASAMDHGEILSNMALPTGGQNAYTGALNQSPVL